MSNNKELDEELKTVIFCQKKQTASMMISFAL